MSSISWGKRAFQTAVGIADLWTVILAEVFGVRAVKIRIDRYCRIRHNAAGFSSNRKPLRPLEKAKGGGIWILQAQFADAPRVDVVIEEVIATVRGNAGQPAYVSKVAVGTKIATANEICIQDLINRKEWTESNYVPLLDHGDLKFKA